MGEGREEIRQRHTEEAETSLGEAWAAALETDARRQGRIQQTGVWISVILSTIHGKELGAQEWRDTFFLRFIINPPEFTSLFDGYGAAF